ncbi:(2Fe-2S)-binding protein [Paraburkholderia strydomiana]|uniref:(2Fe-2S)-binding protein n=1 Tax=Paraburkholderia strydomiana TaxID=1245417 RepID=UPI0038B8E888
MSIDSGGAWFTSLENHATDRSAQERVSIVVDGQLLSVPAEVSVAASLMMAGVRRFSERPVHGGARVPYCMMGVCFECVVDIDDLPGCRACMTKVHSGMRIGMRGAMSRLLSADDDAHEEAGHHD